MATDFVAPREFVKAPDRELLHNASLNEKAYELLNVAVMKELNDIPPLNDGFILEHEELDLSDRYINPGIAEPLDQIQQLDQPQTLESIAPQTGESNPVTDFLDIVESIPENVTPEEYEEYRSQMEPLIEEQARIANDTFEKNPVLLSFLEQSDGELDKLKAAMGDDFYKQPFNDLITQFPRHLYSNQGDTGEIMEALEKSVSEEQQGPLREYLAKVLKVGFDNMDKAPEIVIAFEMSEFQKVIQQHMVDILHNLDDEYYQ